MIHHIILLTLIIPFALHADSDHHQIHSVIKTHQADNHYFMHQNLTHQKANKIIMATPFYFKGIKNHQNATSFMIDHKKKLTVQGDAIAGNQARDIRAEWLGLGNTFNDFFSMQPTAEQAGIIFQHNHNLFTLIPFDFLKHTSICIRMPVLHAKHTLNLEGDSELLHAFNNSAWNYHRFQEEEKKWGIGDITLFTQTSFYQDYVYLHYYTGFIIPTASKYNSDTLFAPQLGNDRRLGLNGGIDIRYILNKQPASIKAVLFLNLDATYLLRTFRHRTFDLKNKPWSRFLSFQDSSQSPTITMPGVNVLTYEAHIRPQAKVDFSFGIGAEHKHFQAELGYNVWGHEGERIKKIKHFIPDRFAIAPSLTSTSLQSASTSNIKNVGIIDTTFMPITRNDIDLQSATAPSVLNHTIFLTLASRIYTEHQEIYIKIGSFGEFAQKKSICSQWGLWGTCALIF